MRPSRRIVWIGAATAVAMLVLSACGASENDPQSSLNPLGPIADDIDDLWRLVFIIATVIFVIVEAVLVFSIVKHRRRRGEEPGRVRQVHGNTPLEVAWTIVPAVLLAVLAVPTVSTLFEVREQPEDVAFEVDVIGHQWWWEFRYPSYGINTANELHIPAGKNVYLNLTSADVIHSFWVPALNGKRDAVPARINNLTLNAYEPTPPGEPLLGQCAEFCGLAHADMRLKVYVHDEAGFAEWVAAQQQQAAVPEEGSQAATGWDVYQRVCIACHYVDAGEAGQPEPPVLVDGPQLPDGSRLQSRMAPDLTHFASRDFFAGATFRSTPENLIAWLHAPSDLKPMQPEYNDLAAGRVLGMPDLGLTAGEVEALVAFLEGLE